MSKNVWKRSDISQQTVLSVYARPFEQRYPVDEMIARETGAPIKVVWAAMMREDSKGHLDYGTNLRGGWLTEKGVDRLNEIQGGLRR